MSVRVLPSAQWQRNTGNSGRQHRRGKAASSPSPEAAGEGAALALPLDTFLPCGFFMRSQGHALAASGRRGNAAATAYTKPLYIFFFSAKIHFHLHVIAVPPEYNSLYVNTPVSFHFTYNTRQYGSVTRVGNIKLQREFSFLIMNCYTDIIIKRLGICGRHEK